MIDTHTAQLDMERTWAWAGGISTAALFHFFYRW
jgi:hypothetical protein